MAKKTKLRLRAAVWAAAIAGVPVFSVLIIRYPGNERDLSVHLFGFALAIALAAGASGYIVGWRLLDPDEDHEFDTAMGLGMATALFAYPILGAFLTIAVGIGDLVNILRDNATWEAVSVQGYAFVLFCGPFVGLVYTGLITLPIAAIAGYFLSRYNRRKRPRL